MMKQKYIELFNKYDVKVIVDNTNNFFPPVIFEEDPNLNNLNWQY